MLKFVEEEHAKVYNVWYCNYVSQTLNMDWNLYVYIYTPQLVWIPYLFHLAEAFENAPGLASPSCASNSDSCFKENINMNKCETPKLSLEPLQMKRKKKGGGYNLRKSLAWDRAFFTEEGCHQPVSLYLHLDLYNCKLITSQVLKTALLSRQVF